MSVICTADSKKSMFHRVETSLKYVFHGIFSEVLDEDLASDSEDEDEGGEDDNEVVDEMVGREETDGEDGNQVEDEEKRTDQASQMAKAGPSKSRHCLSTLKDIRSSTILKLVECM